MIQINAYITFDGNCREAMNFYQSIFGGQLNFMHVAGSPIEAQCPASMKDAILHSTLMEGNNLILMGSDMIGPGGYVRGNNVTLSINCLTEGDINNLYEKLSEGGEILDPLKRQFWGALFAVVVDKFGIKWMMNCEPQAQQ